MIDESSSDKRIVTILNPRWSYNAPQKLERPSLGAESLHTIFPQEDENAGDIFIPGVGSEIRA